MKKLSKAEKKEVLKEIRDSHWTGCLCDKCLIKIAEIILDHQLKDSELGIYGDNGPCGGPTGPRGPLKYN